MLACGLRVVLQLSIIMLLLSRRTSTYAFGIKNHFTKSGTCSKRFLPVQRTQYAHRFLTQTHLFSTKNENISSQQTNNLNEISLKDKIKVMWKSYGYVAIGTYVSVYLVTLSSIFFSLDMDIFHAATVGLDPVSAVTKVRHRR